MSRRFVEPSGAKVVQHALGVDVAGRDGVDPQALRVAHSSAIERVRLSSAAFDAE